MYSKCSIEQGSKRKAEERKKGGKEKEDGGTKENGRNEERERSIGNMGNERYGEMIACRKKHG